MSVLRTCLAAFALMAASPTAKSPLETGLQELLAADRAFSVAADKASDAASGLAPMFDTEVVMPVPGEGHVIGRNAVVAAFRDNPAFKRGRLRWSPVRGGISADGTQGFTFGYLTLSGGDPAKRERKYLAYWIRRPEGWRVAAYRQIVRPAGEVSLTMLPPSLPGFTAPPTNEPSLIASHQKSLAAAEQSFSDHAQKVGLRTAFREFGRQDAMNMYEGASFNVGLDAITANFKEGEPAKIHWSTERSFVAPSGDLGVSIGTIRSNDPKDSDSFPFFTVWRRDSPTAPWRYIAE